MFKAIISVLSLAAATTRTFQTDIKGQWNHAIASSAIMTKDALKRYPSKTKFLQIIFKDRHSIVMHFLIDAVGRNQMLTYVPEFLDQHASLVCIIEEITVVSGCFNIPCFKALEHSERGVALLSKTHQELHASEKNLLQSYLKNYRYFQSDALAVQKLNDFVNEWQRPTYSHSPTILGDECFI